mmetsp:Transcript_7918/g.14504  ORF Transcript_7918/g.14504 Transcript_7918/m.14504 type:complete len:255 (-) Transcript_7918:53-817(-)
MERVGMDQDGALVNCAVGPRDFINSHPCGVYTCMRTKDVHLQGADDVVDVEFHVKRILHGWQQLGNTEMSHEKVEELLGRVAATCSGFRQAFPKAGGRGLIVTLLVFPGEKGEPKIVSHAQPTSKLQEYAELALITNARTVNGNREKLPSVKASSWISERQTLDLLKSSHNATEVIMTDLSGECVLEGLTTNVFVLCDDLKIYTAPSQILEGSVRDIVLEVCRELGVTVVFKFPRVSDAKKGKWLGCFVTSKCL